MSRDPIPTFDDPVPRLVRDRLAMILDEYRAGWLYGEWTRLLDCLETLNRIDDPKNKLRPLPGEEARGKIEAAMGGDKSERNGNA